MFTGIYVTNSLMFQHHFHNEQYNEEHQLVKNTIFEANGVVLMEASELF